MTKEDYREKVEEHRQEIELDPDAVMKMSRAGRHTNKTTKKRRNPLMTILVIVFIFIPAGILGYVWIFFEPGTEVAKVDETDNAIVEIQKNVPSETNTVIVDDTDEAKSSEEQQLEEQATKDVVAAEEAQKVAAQKAKEQEKALKVAEEKKKAEEQAKAQQKSHTVQSTDNLYQISLKYYGNGNAANIAKIKQANNLSSDSISLGQVLMIP